MNILDGIKQFVNDNKNTIELILWLAIAKKIQEADELGCYEKHCNYVIDKNEAVFHIKRLRGLINETRTKER